MRSSFQFCQSDDADADVDAADDSSRQDAPIHYDGEQGISSWDELLYAMTDGALGVKPTRGTPSNDGHKTHRQENQSGR